MMINTQTYTALPTAFTFLPIAKPKKLPIQTPIETTIESQ